MKEDTPAFALQNSQMCSLVGRSGHFLTWLGTKGAMLGMRLESVRPNRATRIKHANPSNAARRLESRLGSCMEVIDSSCRALPFIAELLLFHGRTFREQHSNWGAESCRKRAPHLHNN